jgi:hypothetical protein
MKAAPTVNGKLNPPTSRGRLMPIIPSLRKPSMFRSRPSGWTTTPSLNDTPSSSIARARGATSRAMYSPASCRLAS